MVSPEPLPTFPEGFPEELIRSISKRPATRYCATSPYSGTQVLKDYGEQAMRENALIVYTSADSMFQVAANEELLQLQELYRYCGMASKCSRASGVGRVIARPFPWQHCGYLLSHHQPPQPEPEAAPRHHAGSAERRT